MSIGCGSRARILTIDNLESCERTKAGNEVTKSSARMALVLPTDCSISSMVARLRCVSICWVIARVMPPAVKSNPWNRRRLDGSVTARLLIAAIRIFQTIVIAIDVLRRVTKYFSAVNHGISFSVIDMRLVDASGAGGRMGWI